MINYTIIIPHKNIPDLLQRCLGSIPRRGDVQIIVVDDNSDPGRVDFDNFPGLRDPFIEVVFDKNENGRTGAGYARNLGLERAKGKWVLFADADDFFTENALPLILRHEDSDSDIVYFTTRSVLSDDINTPSHRAHNNAPILDYLNEPGLEAEWRIRYGIPEPWGKMVRLSFLRKNRILFEESVVANDYRFSLEIGHAARKVTAEREALYVATHRDGSLSAQKPTFSIIRTRMHIFNRAQSFFRKNDLPVMRQHFDETMIWLLRFRPVWYLRVCWSLLKEDPRNMSNIMNSFRIIPQMLKSKPR